MHGCWNGRLSALAEAQNAFAVGHLGGALVAKKVGAGWAFQTFVARDSGVEYPFGFGTVERGLVARACTLSHGGWQRIRKAAWPSLAGVVCPLVGIIPVLGVGRACW